MFVSACLTGHMSDKGLLYYESVHWKYYPDKCSLLCADRQCIHSVSYPTLYATLVKPQIQVLKQTGYYKAANLLLYFIVAPFIYTLTLVQLLKPVWKRMDISGYILIGIFTCLTSAIVIEHGIVPEFRARIYWGATDWCVQAANYFHVSLLDVYTLIFGISIPLSIVGCILYLTSRIA